jgi:hypothetical protein
MNGAGAEHYLLKAREVDANPITIESYEEISSRRSVSKDYGERI